jgi:hypothetical protein
MNRDWGKIFKKKYSKSVLGAYPEYTESHLILLNDMKNFIDDSRQELLAEIEKEIIGRLPAFPPQEKAVKMADIKLFSANDILDIIKKLKQ